MKNIERQIDYIMERLKESGANPDSEWTINFSVYDDDALRTLRPTEDWNGGAEEHRKMMGYARAVINSKYPKINVNLVEIKLDEYLQYLAENGIQDNEGKRAKYISLKTNGQI